MLIFCKFLSKDIDPNSHVLSAHKGTRIKRDLKNKYLRGVIFQDKNRNRKHFRQ